VLLLTTDDEFAQPNSSPEGLRALIHGQLPQFSHLVSDDTIKAVAAKSPSNIPRVRTVGPELHKGSSTVLLGDAKNLILDVFYPTLMSSDTYSSLVEAVVGVYRRC